MKNVMKKLDELNEKHASDEEYKKFLGSLSEEEWKFIVREVPKTPYLGKLDKLRREALEENKETA